MKRVVRTVGLAARVLPRRVRFGIYGVRPLARALRSVLNALVPDGTQGVTVVAGPLAGTRLALDLKREKYLWLGTYELWLQGAILRHCRPRAWAWDVGTSVGYHTLLMRRAAGPGRVVAHRAGPREPGAPRAEPRAERGARRGRAPGGRGRPSTSDEDRRRPERRTLRGRDADGLLERLPPPRVVKMDVAGAEAEILTGALRLLSEVGPVRIVELHGDPGARAAKRLREAGYALSAIGGGVDLSADLPVGGPAHVVAVP